MRAINKLFALSLVVFLATAISTNTTAELAGEKTGESILIETDTLAVEIKGGTNVPFFFFWHQNALNTTYNLHLDKVFEVIDLNDNGVYDPDTEVMVPNSMMSLPSLNWEFSEFETEIDENNVTTALHFNLTSSDSNAMPNQDDPIIQFRIHLTSANDAELKFDVAFDNYTFTDETAMLVVGFKMTNSENHEMVRNNDTVSFGDGYFQYEENATSASNRTLQVGLSTNVENDNPMIYLSYEHFEDSMVHDPIIGVIGDGDVITDSTTDGEEESDKNSESDDNEIKVGLPDLSRESLFASTVLATALFILVPVTLYFRRR